METREFIFTNVLIIGLEGLTPEKKIISSEKTVLLLMKQEATGLTEIILDIHQKLQMFL